MIVAELLAHIGFKVEHEPLEKLESSLEGIKERLNLIIGVEAVTKLYELAERFAHWGEELHVTAENIGVTVEQLQSMTYAAEKAGVSQELMTHSLAHLSRELYNAKTGSKEAQQQFTKIGISGDQIARFKGTQDALDAVADRLAAIEDPIKRMGLAQELLGRGGFKMIAFLSQGSKKIREEGDELRKLGLQLSGPQVHALVEVEHAFHRLHSVMAAIGAQIASYVGPAFTFLVDKFISLYSANKQVIGSGLTTWLDALLYGLGYVSGTIYNLIKRILGMGDAFKSAFKAEGIAGVLDTVSDKVKKIFSPELLKSVTDKLETFLGSDAFAAAVRTALEVGLVASGFAFTIGWTIFTGFSGAAAEWLASKLGIKTEGGETAASAVNRGLGEKVTGAASSDSEVVRVMYAPLVLSGKVTEAALAGLEKGGELTHAAVEWLKTFAPGGKSATPGSPAATAPNGRIGPIVTTPAASLTSVSHTATTTVGGSVSLHAPTTVNVNVPSGTTPAHAEEIGKAAARGAVKEFHDETMRKTMRSLPTGS